MYILVNEKNIIVGSAVKKPSEAHCSANNQKIYEIPNEEYTPEIIGSELVEFDVVRVGVGGNTTNE